MWCCGNTATELLPATRLAEKLQAGANVNRADSETDRTALHLAAALGEQAALSTLLEARADVLHFDSDNRSPLALACLHGQGAAVAQLLSATSPKHVAPLLGFCGPDEA